MLLEPSPDVYQIAERAHRYVIRLCLSPILTREKVPTTSS
jgi:hypothetical protein